MKALPCIAGVVHAAALLVCTGGLTAKVLDGFDPNVDEHIRAITVQSDGKIVIGGNFGSVGGVPRPTVARINSDGTVDETFVPYTSGSRESVAIQRDGRILAAGPFGDRIIRMEADGSRDWGFSSGADGSVVALTPLDDGKILVGGSFRTLAGHHWLGIGRLWPDGSLDHAFNAETNGQFFYGQRNIIKIMRQPDGRILAGGLFQLFGPHERTNFARFLHDGRVDTSFVPEMRTFVFALQPDEKIIGVGSEVFRLNPDGSVDPSFQRVSVSGSEVGASPVMALVLQPDGKIVIGGTFTNLGGLPRARLGRVLPNGAVDLSFMPAGTGYVLDLALQTDGKILVAGAFSSLCGEPRNNLGRLNPDGSLDQTLNPAASEIVWSLGLQPDGKVLVGRSFLDSPDQRLQRYKPDGTVDHEFSTTFETTPPLVAGDILSIVPQADGKLLVGGEFRLVNGQPRTNLVRLHPNGSLDLSFDPAPDREVYELTALANGQLLVAGRFTTLKGQPRYHIGRLNLDGTLDMSFTPQLSGLCDDCPYGVLSALEQADGKILIGGGFTHISGQPHQAIGRLNPDGSVDADFGASAGHNVMAMALQADGRILVGGHLFTLNGTTYPGLGRLSPDGSLDSSFAVQPFSGDVSTIALQTDGKIIVGGSFSVIGGQPCTNLARLNVDGSIDPAFRPAPNGRVMALGIQADGYIVAAGFFTEIDGQPRSRLARLSSGGAALQHLAVDAQGTSVIWTRTGTAPEIEHVTFELSTDGTSYMLLGRPRRVSGGWMLSNLSLPAGRAFYVRARGRASCSTYCGSSGLIESIAQFYRIPSPDLTPVQTGTGRFQFAFTNVGRHGFTVLATTNISAPADEWQVLGAAEPIGNCVYQFTDPGAALYQRRFYLLRWP